MTETIGYTKFLLRLPDHERVLMLRVGVSKDGRLVLVRKQALVVKTETELTGDPLADIDRRVEAEVHLIDTDPMQVPFA